MTEAELKAIEARATLNDDLPSCDLQNLSSDVHELVAEVRKLRAALDLIQWGSCDGCGNKYCCPECGGNKPHPECPRDEDDPPEGHKPDCPVGLALG